MILPDKAGNFWICYDADGSPFEGPFASAELAQARVDSLKPVDRMLVGCQGPYLKTSTTWLADRKEQHVGFDNELRLSAEKKGVSTTGKVRIGQLCRPNMPDDPEAWVSDLGDVKRVLEKRNWSAEGIHSATVRDEPPKPSVELADSIVQERVAEELAGQTVTKTQYLDTCEKVREKHKPKYKF